VVLDDDRQVRIGSVDGDIADRRVGQTRCPTMKYVGPYGKPTTVTGVELVELPLFPNSPSPP
jgi:hypothetical protein